MKNELEAIDKEILALILSGNLRVDHIASNLIDENTIAFEKKDLRVLHRVGQYLLNDDFGTVVLFVTEDDKDKIIGRIEYESMSITNTETEVKSTKRFSIDKLQDEGVFNPCDQLRIFVTPKLIPCDESVKTDILHPIYKTPELDRRTPVITQYELGQEEREYEIWMEGYSCTGQHQSAVLLGKQAGSSFDDAVEKFKLAHAPDHDSIMYSKERQKWSTWGCALYDNESDARKAFG